MVLVAILLAAAISVVEVVRFSPADPVDVIVLVVMAAAVTCVIDDVDVVVPVDDDVIDSEEIRKLVSSTVVAVEVVPVDGTVLNTVAAVVVVVVKLVLHVAAIDDIASRSMCCNVTRFAYFFLNRRMLRCKNSCLRDV